MFQGSQSFYVTYLYYYIIFLFFFQVVLLKYMRLSAEKRLNFLAKRRSGRELMRFRHILLTIIYSFCIFDPKFPIIGTKET